MEKKSMIGETVKFMKNGKFVRGKIAEVFYFEEEMVEGFAVSRTIDGTEYVTYEKNVVFV